MRPQSSRLGHKKSRNGCIRCKQRHVKCDEQRPCRNCLRFDAPCSLVQQAVEQTSKESPDSASTPGSTTNKEQPTPSGTVIVAQGDSAESETCQFPATWLQSLRLLHHYDTAVCAILSHEQTTEKVWKIVVPQAAFSHAFLMNGLLALSALHYAQCHPDQRREYMLISSHLQSLAVQSFSTRLQHISEDNFEPYFFLATFVFVISMCSIADHQDQGTPPPPSDIAQSFLLLHGVQSICDFKPMETWSRDGPLGPLLQDDSLPSLNPTGAFQTRMDRVYALARDLSPSFEAINVRSSCILALESLRTIHAACADETSGLRARRMWMWPISLTHVFIDLITKRHHVALILLAHYAALAKPFEHPHWMNRGWSSNVMASVEHALEEQWHEWIAWPKRSLLEGINVDEMEP